MQCEYYRPASVPEALSLLQDHGDKAKVLAGGQSLVAAINLGLLKPQVVVDIGRIPGLRAIHAEGDRVIIGATTRHREVEESGLLRETCPILPAAAHLIGHRHIRNRGTIGGSVAHADPAAEYPVVLSAMDAEIHVQSAEGERKIPANAFFIGPLTTAMGPSELLTAISVPAWTGGWSFREFTLRAGDFAIVSVAALIRKRGHVVTEVRLAVGGAGPTPVRCRQTEAWLTGKHGDDDVWAAAGRLAAEEVDPDSDVHASADYRRHLAAVYVRDALKEANANANG